MDDANQRIADAPLPTKATLRARSSLPYQASGSWRSTFGCCAWSAKATIDDPPPRRIRPRQCRSGAEPARAPRRSVGRIGG